MDNTADITINSYPGVNIRELIETHDLKNPMAVRSLSDTNKNEKDDTNEEFDAGAAFLGPTLWDKTLSDFKLEYLDLDEFLQDNGVSDNDINRFKNSFNNKTVTGTGIAVTTNESLEASTQQSAEVKTDGKLVSAEVKSDNKKNTKSVVKPSSDDRHKSSSTSSFYQNVDLGSPLSVSSASNDSFCQVSALSPDAKGHSLKESLSSTIHKNRESTSSKLQVGFVDYKVNPNELALASVPGQNFDPVNHSFSEDELKPQPMIKKSKKQFVPEEFKDDKYWARRRKNNVAARRSREARRVKENQIVLRASYLEKENSALKEEISKLRHDNMMLKKKIHRHEQQSS